MTPVKHIMIATDGSELSLKAAAFGGELARALDASVSVVMVLDERSVIPQAWGAVGFPGTEGLEAISTDDVREFMERKALADEVAKTCDAIGRLDTDPEQVLLWGHAANQLCDFAKDNDVDMIVLGSHGRTGIKRAILGSVSHNIANRAHCAVTIVR